MLGSRFKANEFFADIASIGRWAIRYFLIGLIAGCASVLFYYLCQLGMRLFLDGLAGFRPPAAAGEYPLFSPGSGEFTRWVLLILPACGGLLSGWLVYSFAPEAAGGGNDAVIDAYHNKESQIRSQVPLIKTLATVITLTTGGSGGREGPIAQIAGGLGSLFATKFGLSVRDRRILMAAGIAAGVGSIFRAPLAGALFAAEFLYRDPEFEYEVIIPAGMASTVGYCMFCLVYGWGSLLQSPDFVFRNPIELCPYLILALFLAVFGILFIVCFRTAGRMFDALKIPVYLKPALGGLCTGVIGFFLPNTLAFGYGYAQQALTLEAGPLILMSLAVGKILTTSFSIGSGGSGGLFGPSIVIGAALGGAFGQVMNRILPEIVSSPGAFALVGMAGFFAAVSNTPISTIIFVSEMTNSYHLLLPSLLVCSVAYLATRRWTIFPHQVSRRIDSPAHAGEFFVDVLQAIKVKDLRDCIRKVVSIRQEMPLVEFKAYFSQTEQHYFPVVDQAEKLVGIFSINDIRGVLFATEVDNLIVMKDIGTSDIITSTLSEDLNSVLKKFTIKNIDSLPVVSEVDPRELIGMLNRREVIAYYNKRVQNLKILPSSSPRRSG
ncbi:MAG: chloride channel protein [Deltaproteobacteria bacterium]|nr:chloride channel protein [Deltaproteobacteria bacterium]